jgi:peptidoglycan/LPS O-acetylase OafA/YrhL
LQPETYGKAVGLTPIRTRGLPPWAARAGRGPLGFLALRNAIYLKIARPASNSYICWAHSIVWPARRWGIVESGRRGRSAPLLDLPIGRSRAVGIDLLRGLLAVAVLVTHLISWGQVTGSYSGLAVDWNTDVVKVFQPAGETYPAVLAFIVLSGYCIHRNGLRRGGGASAVSAYGIRRFFRIVPVYLLAVIAGVVAFGYLQRVNPEVGTSLTSTSSISGDCLLSKVTGTAVFNPSDYSCSLQGNTPLATVLVEIWLYVVYAFVGVLLLRRALSDRWLAIGVALAWIGGMVWVNAHPADAAWWHNGSLLGFLAFWWIGAKFTDPAFATRVRRVLPLVLTGWLAMTIVLMQMGTDSIFFVEARKMLFGLAIGVLIVAVDGLAIRRLERPGRVGQAGYSIYAFHAPVVLALLIAGVPWYIVGLLAILVGLLAFWLYERPLNRLGRRLARRRSDRPVPGLAKPRPAGGGLGRVTASRPTPLAPSMAGAGIARTTSPAIRGTSPRSP